MGQTDAPYMLIDTAFGRLLKEQRSICRFTQADLALRAGIAVSFISRMERGRACPTIDTLFRIAKAFEVAPEEIVKRLRQITDETAE
jgi:transcriptional regulator with XRE-family HTH domain